MTATFRRTTVALPLLEGPSGLYGGIGDFLSQIDAENDFLGFRIAINSQVHLGRLTTIVGIARAFQT